MLVHEFQEKQKPSRVLILGGNGFVGKHLISKLTSEGVDFLAYSSKDLDLLDQNSVIKFGSVLKESDAIVFLSCLTPDRGKDADTLMKNLTMANNVAKLLSEKKISQLIYISSDAVYDTNSNPINESTKPVAGDLYSYMHLGRELILDEAARKTKTPYCVLRPAAMFGEGDTHNSYGPNRFLKQAIEKKEIPLFGNGEEKRDHLHVDDLAEVIWQCLALRSQGLLNIATGQSYSFFQVAEKIKSQIEGTKINCMPRANGEVSHKHFDITQLIEALPGIGFKSALE